jgi:hypothetical protein
MADLEIKTDDQSGIDAEERRNIADSLAVPGVDEIEFEAPRVTIESRPADFLRSFYA